MNSVAEPHLSLELSRRFDASPERVFDAWLRRGHYNDQQTLITLYFRPDGDGTVMTLRQEGFGNAQMRDGYGNGWGGMNGSFAKLDAVLARESGASTARARG
jgi:uncharacterized protein YndB with AHSA1/START domain